jgi:hypothetical protein
VEIRSDDDPMGPQLRCARCGEVIGVYEPMLFVEDGTVRETSRLREQGRAPGWALVEDCYHENCFELAFEEAHKPHLHRSRRPRGSSEGSRRDAGRNQGGGPAARGRRRAADGRRAAVRTPGA